jgi:Fe-S-cluster containining protein
VSRCTGDCCRAFVLNASPEELRTWSAAHLRSALAAGRPLIHSEREQWFIATMLIPLDLENLPEDAVKAMGPKAVEEARAGNHVLYTCKHLNRETGDCSVYDDRPNMCRIYPDNGFAPHGGCGFPNCTASCSRKARQEAEAAAMELEKA